MLTDLLCYYTELIVVLYTSPSNSAFYASKERSVLMTVRLILLELSEHCWARCSAQMLLSPPPISMLLRLLHVPHTDFAGSCCCSDIPAHLTSSMRHLFQSDSCPWPQRALSLARCPSPQHSTNHSDTVSFPPHQSRTDIHAPTYSHKAQA